MHTKGYEFLHDVFAQSEMNDVRSNIIAFTNIFRQKIKADYEICEVTITSDTELSEYLKWLDKYNNKYLFEFIGLVAQLPALKKLQVNATLINKTSEYLGVPVDELLIGAPSFLVNTPASERLITQWHNAKNYYPKRELHVNYWVPLVIPKVAGNGSLRIAEGSHLQDYPFLEFIGPDDSAGKGALTQNLIPAELIEPFNKITIDCNIGSCVGMLPKTVHSGSRNNSQVCSYVMVFKIWAMHKDWTLSKDLAIKYFSGDPGAGSDVVITK